MLANTPDRIRTYNLRFRRPMLYPVELRVQGSVLSCFIVGLIVYPITAKEQEVRFHDSICGGPRASVTVLSDRGLGRRGVVVG